MSHLPAHALLPDHAVASVHVWWQQTHRVFCHPWYSMIGCHLVPLSVCAHVPGVLWVSSFVPLDSLFVCVCVCLCLCVCMSYSATIGEVVAEWARQSGVSSAGVSLVFRGKRLSNESAFGSAGIPSGSVVDVHSPLAAAPAASAAPGGFEVIRRPATGIGARPGTAQKADAPTVAGAGLVRVAVQLPGAPYVARIYRDQEVGASGTRLEAQLPSRFSLWDVLTAIEAQHGVALTTLVDDQGMFCMPVLVEMRREFTGLKELKTTTLFSKGMSLLPMNTCISCSYARPSLVIIIVVDGVSADCFLFLFHWPGPLLSFLHRFLGRIGAVSTRLSQIRIDGTFGH